jgi:hypothetical protein
LSNHFRGASFFVKIKKLKKDLHNKKILAKKALNVCSSQIMLDFKNKSGITVVCEFGLI